MKKKFLYVISMCFLANAGIDAQVTMGSGFAPNKGTLLDLKEYNDPIALGGGRNSDRGVILPRVKLTVNNSLADITGAAGTGYEGLMVYNVNDEAGLCPGLHVWDGTNWVGLQSGTAAGSGSEVLNESTGKGTLTDHQNNKYTVAKFGNKWWTTQNMRNTSTVSKCGGVGESFERPTAIGAGQSQEVRKKLYHVPQPNQGGNIWSSNDESQWLKEYGLLYNWRAATGRGDTTGTECFANEGGSTTPNYQGLCPVGWHIPSDREWTDLENELILNSTIYSSYSGAIASDYPLQYSPSATSPESRGINTLGPIIKLHPSDAGMTIPAPSAGTFWAYSKKPNERGFAALMVGAAGMSQGSYKYGELAEFISSSNYDEGDGTLCNRFWVRYMEFGSGTVERDKAHRYALFSVRCVKD